MSKFTEYIGSQFANPRGFIGRLCCVIMNVMNKKMYRKVISSVCISNKSNVLDIGYGNGYLIKRLYKKYRPNIFGIDISEDMKKQAYKRNKKATKDNKLNLFVGDCCNLTFENEFFDTVTSINTIYFWKDIIQGLKQINRVLKKDGEFHNVVYTKEWLKKLSYTKTGFNFFEKEDYIDFGIQAGYSNVIIEDIVEGKSFTVVYKK